MNTQPSVTQLERELVALKLWVKSMDNRDHLQAMSKQARGYVLLQIYENKRAIAELTILIGEMQIRRQLSSLNVSKWTATLGGTA